MERPKEWNEPLDMMELEWNDAAAFVTFFGGLTRSETIKGGNSIPATTVALFKALVCSGITFTPAATAKCGWMFAVFAYPVLAVLAICGVQYLTRCMQLYTTHRSFADLAFEAYGATGHTVINWSIVLTQSAFCSIYILFVAKTVPPLIGIPQSSPYYQVAQLTTLIVETAFFIPFSWVREVKNLTVVNKFGSAGILFGIFVMISMFGSTVLEHGVHPDAVAVEKYSWPQFVGVAGFTFEGIAAILPVHQAMEPQAKKYWTPVFLTMIAFVTVCLVSVGVLGYMAVGPNVETLALESLRPSWMTTTSQLVYCGAIVCSFPLQFFPVPNIIEAVLYEGNTSSLTAYRSRLLRAIYILALSSLAYSCRDHLEAMVEVVGSLLAIPLMIIFPAMIHLQLRGYKSGRDMAIDGFMILIGCAITAICTLTSLGFKFQNTAAYEDATTAAAKIQKEIVKIG